MFWQMFFAVLAVVFIYKSHEYSMRAYREGYGNALGVVIWDILTVAVVVLIKWVTTFFL
jgi:hypothetical protein